MPRQVGPEQLVQASHPIFHQEDALPHVFLEIAYAMMLQPCCKNGSSSNPSNLVMRALRSHNDFAQIVLAALLLLAVLSSQWAGLQHRVGHPGLNSANTQQIDLEAAGDKENGNHLSHICLLFDAAALGVALYTPFIAPPCSRAQSAPIEEFMGRSWQARFIHHFSSRAPPLN